MSNGHLIRVLYGLFAYMALITVICATLVWRFDPDVRIITIMLAGGSLLAGLGVIDRYITTRWRSLAASPAPFWAPAFTWCNTILVVAVTCLTLVFWRSI